MFELCKTVTRGGESLALESFPTQEAATPAEGGLAVEACLRVGVDEGQKVIIRPFDGCLSGCVERFWFFSVDMTVGTKFPFCCFADSFKA